MSLVIPDEGAPILLVNTLKGAGSPVPSWLLGLYQNAYTPDSATTFASFSESSFTGYARYGIDPSKWLTPTIISSRASSTYDAPGPVTWTNGGSSQNVYGYFVIDNSTGKILWAERFATARTMATGDELDLTLIFTGGTQI